MFFSICNCRCKQKNHLNLKDSSGFLSMELLSRFELETSSLPRVYLLEEIVLVNNNWLNPVWIIEIVYFIQRKKSTQVGKITNYNKKTP